MKHNVAKENRKKYEVKYKAPKKMLTETEYLKKKYYLYQEILTQLNNNMKPLRMEDGHRINQEKRDAEIKRIGTICKLMELSMNIEKEEAVCITELREEAELKNLNHIFRLFGLFEPIDEVDKIKQN